MAFVVFLSRGSVHCEINKKPTNWSVKANAVSFYSRIAADILYVIYSHLVSDWGQPIRLLQVDLF